MKHAFLIIAHKMSYNLSVLLRMLDYCNNDIYIHVDAKAFEFNYEQLDLIKRSIRYSNIIVLKNPISVNWGGYSMIEAEILLLEEAMSKGKYNYFHLLSGDDLPIQNMSHIHEFFENNKGKEFIGFENYSENNRPNYESRVRYYWFFQEKAGKYNRNIIISETNSILLAMQRLLHIKRNKQIEFHKGSQWFSITDRFAAYIIDKKNLIRKIYKYTSCGDEIFIQTLCINSEFKDNLYCQDINKPWPSSMRLIDWKRGNPYVFKVDDFEVIKNSDKLFARKFDDEVDKEIIDMIENQYICKLGK
jgi:hypothetical protein